VIVICNSKR